jgi:hypothetical protein
MSAYSFVKELVVFFVCGCIHIYFNYSAQKTAHDFYTKHSEKSHPIIYDIVHENIADNYKWDWIRDVIIVISFIPFLLNFNLKFLKEYIGLMLTIMIIRDITINMTILPKDERCKKTDSLYANIIGDCYDKIFSGHFATVFILSLLYYSYQYITNIPFLILWNIMNTFFIITTRSHYTVDVFVSILVCYIVYDKDLNLFKLVRK